MPRTRSRARREQVDCLLLGLLDDHLLISCAASLGVKGLGRLVRVCSHFCAAEGESIPEAAARLAVAWYSQGERDKAPRRGELAAGRATVARPTEASCPVTTGGPSAYFF